MACADLRILGELIRVQHLGVENEMGRAQNPAGCHSGVWRQVQVDGMTFSCCRVHYTEDLRTGDPGLSLVCSPSKSAGLRVLRDAC